MRLRKLTALASAFLLTFGVASTVLAGGGGMSVPICHGTDSESNPYIAESPDVSSTGLLLGGHNDHIGPVWYPGAKADKVVWGDIIPPYTFDTGDGIFSFPGLNWTAEGQAILKADCNIVPAIHIVKAPSDSTLPPGGGDVTYTYTVTNAGDVPLSNVTVTDNKCSPVDYQSGDTNSDNKLDVDETWTFTCSANLTETTMNTGTATGHEGDTTVTDTDDATVTVQPPVVPDAPAMSIDKTADPTTLPAGGGDVKYTYVVKNTGNVPIFDVAVTDDNGTPADTSDDFTVTCPKNALDVDESMTCTATVTGITVDTTNIGTANADWDSCHDDCKTPVTPATDDATVTVQPVVPPNAPAIHVEKTASVANLPVGGGSVTYTYVVTNTGDVALTDISVTDNKCAPVDLKSGDTNDDQILDKTETWTYTCTTTITATTTNTAVATGHDGETTVTDTDNATVPVATPGGGVQGETNVPTPPSTDIASGNVTSSPSGSIPFMLIILGVIGLAAVALMPVRNRR